MVKKFQSFERNALKLKPLSDRIHDLNISNISRLTISKNYALTKNFDKIAQKIIYAKKNNASRIMIIGGHVIRSGVQKYLIDLIERGYISCIATNGSGIIHDFELALIGATTESVSRYIKEGQFGLWEETGQLNNIINKGYKEGLGMGEAIGKAILEGDFPYKDISLLAACYRFNIPATVHVSIGYDIIHEHPNCDGAATGATSYQDFLYFTKIVENLEDGLVMNFGSAVMAPEVFLKALSMARNVAREQGRVIKHFSTLVCDLHVLPDNFTKEPDKNDPSYYFRPWKTMLVRTVADGGESFYIRGNHSETIPALWTVINEMEKR